MNSLRASIKEIRTIDNLTLVNLAISTQNIELWSLELPPSITIDDEVDLLVKSTDIILSKHINRDISCTNQLEANIYSIEKGVLLSSIVLDIEGYKLESLISTFSFESMVLTKGDPIYALIPQSDISIRYS